MSPPTGSTRTRSTRCARSSTTWRATRSSSSRRTSSRRSTRCARARSSSPADASSPTIRPPGWRRARATTTPCRCSSPTGTQLAAARGALAALPAVAEVEVSERDARLTALPRAGAQHPAGGSGARRAPGAQAPGAAPRVRPARRSVPHHHRLSPKLHAQRGHHHAPRAGELLRDAARLRLHPDLPGAGERLHLLPGRLLRARPGRPRPVLHLPSLAVPVPDPGGVDAAVGRGAQVRQHRAADDAAGDAAGGGARQIPRGVGLHRAGAGAHLPAVDHGQLPRQAR